MIKRCFDIGIAAVGLLLALPILLPVLLLVWLQDFKSPFYAAPRAARRGGMFRMLKIRSMVANADRTGVNSTAGDDPRITRIGKFVRAYKVDELTQLWNVLAGDMSLVGPRPQVKADTDSYTSEERRMLTVRPGITDPASIVFSDEGEILRGSTDPDLLYNQVIRPWKSRLALLYIDHMGLATDIQLIGLTVLAILSKPAALNRLVRLLEYWKADPRVIATAARTCALERGLPPGMEDAAGSLS